VTSLHVRAKTARTLAEVEAVIKEAIALRSAALEAGDLRLMRHSVEVRWHAERLGGRLLSDSDNGKNTAPATRWRTLAAMSEDEFAAKLKCSLSRQRIAPRNSGYGTKMKLSGWRKDENGFPTRILTAESEA